MQKRQKRGSDKKGHRLFEKRYGPIPKGFHVHHRNGDHSDNSIENLILMKGSDHLAWHNLKRLSENIQKSWNTRPKYARYKKLESGPFICVFNDDGSSQIMYIDSSENEQDKEA